MSKGEIAVLGAPRVCTLDARCCKGVPCKAKVPWRRPATSAGGGGAAEAASASRPAWDHNALAGKRSVPYSAALGSSSAPSAKAIAAADYWQRQKEVARDARTGPLPSMLPLYLGGLLPALAPAPVPPPIVSTGPNTPQVGHYSAPAMYIYLAC